MTGQDPHSVISDGSIAHDSWTNQLVISRSRLIMGGNEQGSQTSSGLAPLQPPPGFERKIVWTNKHYVKWPNLEFGPTPVFIVDFQLPDEINKSTSQFPALTKILLRIIPELEMHKCGLGVVGGLGIRLSNEGIFPIHAIEHLTVEYLAMIGVTVKDRIVGPAKTRSHREGSYTVTIACDFPDTTEAAIHEARNLFEELIQFSDDYTRYFRSALNLPLFFAAKENELKRKFLSSIKTLRECYKKELDVYGSSTRILMEAAKRRNIPIWLDKIRDEGILILGNGKHLHEFKHGTLCKHVPALVVDRVGNKALTNRILNQEHIPAPYSIVVTTLPEAFQAFRELRQAFGDVPLVVKPVWGHHGNGVSLNIVDERTLQEAFDLAVAACAHGHIPLEILVELQYSGEDYRTILLDGKVVDTVKRIPAHVIGNSEKNTIRELIEIENQNPARGEDHSSTLTRINVSDLRIIRCLERAGLTLDSIPEVGEIVYLYDIANISVGGTGKFIDDIAPEVIEELESTALALDATEGMIAVDIKSTGIEKNHSRKRDKRRELTVIEVNANPAIRIHTRPDGTNRPAEALLDSHFGTGPNQGRIDEVIGITGSNGKTTTTGLVTHYFWQDYREETGSLTSNGWFLGQKCISSGDHIGSSSMKRALKDKRVGVLIAEIGRGGLKYGLGCDQLDRALILPVTPEHIGQDGLETVEDVLFTKALVIEMVRPGGTIGLYTDVYKHLLKAEKEKEGVYTKLLKGGSRNVNLFSLNFRDRTLQSHIKSGQRGLAYRDGWIVEGAWSGTKVTWAPLVKAEELPITLNGLAKFNILNVLGTFATLLDEKADRSKIIEALKSFKPEQNPGRMEWIHFRTSSRNVHLLLDYAHNPDAFRNVGDYLALLPRDEIPGVTGDHIKISQPISSITAVIGAPGDRDNKIIKAIGRKLAKWPADATFILRDDKDRRNRNPHEIPDLINEGLRSVAPARAVRDHLIMDHLSSLKKALQSARENEVIYYAYEYMSDVVKVLKEVGVTSAIDDSLERLYARASTR